MIKKATILFLTILMILLALALVNELVYSFMSFHSSLYLINRNPKYYFLIYIFFVMIIFLFYKRLINKKIKILYFILPFLFILFFGILNIYYGDVELRYDPKRYFNSGILIANNIDAFDINNIYLRRALFYTSSIFYFLPNALASVQIVNLILLLSSGMIFTYIINKEFGKSIAFYFIIFYALRFEFYTSIAIASHNIASIFYFALLSLFLYLIDKKKLKYFRYIIILIIGVLFVINDFVRDIKLPLLISVLLILGLKLSVLKNIIIKRKASNIFLTLLLITAIFIVIEKNMDRPKIYQPENIVYSYNELGTKGNWPSGLENRFNYINLLDASESKTLVFEKLLSQISHHPISFFKLIYRKSTTFTGSTFTYPTLNLKYEFFKSPPFSPYIALFILVLFLSSKIICYSIAAIFLIKLSNKKSSFILSKVYMVYGLILFSMLLLVEVNNSYDILIFPTICFLAAIGFHSFTKKKIKKATKFNYSFFKPFYTLIGFLVLLFLFCNLYINISAASLFDFSRNRFTVVGSKNLEIKEWNPYELRISNNKSEFSQLILQNEKQISKTSFLLKTKSKPESFEIYINKKIVKPTSFQKDKTPRNNYNDYYYYYVKSPVSTILSNKVSIKFCSLKDDWTIKDILSHR